MKSKTFSGTQSTFAPRRSHLVPTITIVGRLIRSLQTILRRTALRCLWLTAGSSGVGIQRVKIREQERVKIRQKVKNTTKKKKWEPALRGRLTTSQAVILLSRSPFNDVIYKTVVSISCSEWHELAGHNKHRQKREKWRNRNDAIDQIIQGFSLSKTVNVDTFGTYIEHSNR